MFRAVFRGLGFGGLGLRGLRFQNKKRDSRMALVVRHQLRSQVRLAPLGGSGFGEGFGELLKVFRCLGFRVEGLGFTV